MSGLEVILEVESSKSCRRFGPLSLNGTNLDITLGDFVVSLLNHLEDEGKLSLPDYGDELIVDRKDFKVCRANDEDLCLAQKLNELSYFREFFCSTSGNPLLLKAKSEGFLPTEKISRSYTRPSITRGPPLIPDRDESLEGAENGTDLKELAGMKPLDSNGRPRSRHASKFSDTDAMYILSNSQLTNSSSGESSSMTSQDLSEVEYPRRKTLPVIQPEKKERIERSNTIDTGRNLRRIPSPLPDLPEEEGRKAAIDKIRKLVKNPSLTIVFDKVQVFSVEFQLLGKICIEMECQGGFTVRQIKDALWNKVRLCNIDNDEDLCDFIQDPEKYVLKYSKDERWYDLIDEQQIFQATALVRFWCNEPNQVRVMYLEHKRALGKQEQLMDIEISSLLGFGLYQFTFADNSELEMTRRKLVGVRQRAVSERSPRLYTMEPDYVTSHLPQHIIDKIEADQIIIQVHMVSTLQMKKYYTHIHTTADEFLSDVLKDGEVLGVPQGSTSEDFVLKMPDRDAYIIGSVALIHFQYIRRCLSEGLPTIRLYMVPALDVKRDFPRDLPDWNLVDKSTGVAGTHQQLSALGKPHEQVYVSSMWDIPTMFRVKAIGLDKVKKEVREGCSMLYLEAGIYHGGQLVVPAVRTSEVSVTSAHPRWNQWLKFNVKVKNLPKAARLHIRILGRVHKDKKKELTRKDTKMYLLENDQEGSSEHVVLLWVNFQILNHRSLLRQGRQCLTLWPAVSDGAGTKDAPPMSPVGTNACNPNTNQAVALHLELDSYAHPVACPVAGWKNFDSLPQTQNVHHMHQKELDNAIGGDPLRQLDQKEKELILHYKVHCTQIAGALPKFLQCVNWADLEEVAEMHYLLGKWTKITKEVALELLDYNYPDEKVRSMAVQTLQELENGELVEILLQLVQVLKFEAYDDSALARFLLRRAVMSKRIGHYFFWYLKSEMEHPGYKQRFGILLEAYLKGCGESMLADLRKQHDAVQKFVKISIEAKSRSEKHAKRNDFVRIKLAQEDVTTGFSPIFDPSLKTGSLSVDKAKVMVSKKAPLWIEFENSRIQNPLELGRSIKLIIKHGDDLRQDMLTLQMLKIMDKLWQEEGLYLHIVPYGCIATGQDQGVIEVVQNAETVAKIQTTYGGKIGATFKEDPIFIYLQKMNPDTTDFQKAIQTFLLSCAGYCVGTYVLGIGDRHNDNIMVSANGNLFHIDFGHFLGNIKYKAGVKRDRAPFVLTPDFVYIMGGKDSATFRRFEETCVKAYLILRRHANLFINLFSMMKSTGIPELQSVKDIEYLRKVFLLGQSDAAAEDSFKEKIQECLRLSWTVQMNWWFHVVRN